MILSPLFNEHGGGNSDFLFTNKIAEELSRSCANLHVRLLSFYSPSNIPAGRLYIGGIRRNVFGQGPEDDFFYLGSVEGGQRREDFHIHVAHLNIHGLLNWEVKITSAADIRETLRIPKGIVIELGISHSSERMKPIQYLPFALATNDLVVRLKTFQRIEAQTSVGLVEVYIPPLANVYHPFNFIKATTSKQQNSLSNSLIGQEIIFTLPVDYYSKQHMWDNAHKFLTTLGCSVWEEDGRLVCNQGEVGQCITLHEKLVSFWDVRGVITSSQENSVSFLADGLSFGHFKETLTIPNPMILECDLLEHTMVGSRPFKLLRMLFPETKREFYGKGCKYLFDNIQMVETIASNICTIGFKLLDHKGSDVNFAKTDELMSGTLIIKNA